MPEHRLLHRLAVLWVQLRERLHDQGGYTTETVAMTTGLAALAILVVSALTIVVMRYTNSISL